MEPNSEGHGLPKDSALGLVVRASGLGPSLSHLPWREHGDDDPRHSHQCPRRGSCPKQSAIRVSVRAKGKSRKKHRIAPPNNQLRFAISWSFESPVPCLLAQSSLISPARLPLQVPGTLAAGAERLPWSPRHSCHKRSKGLGFTALGFSRPTTGAGGAPLCASEGTAAREAWRSMSERNTASSSKPKPRT